MFKDIIQKVGAFGHSKAFDRIRIEYGEILAQAECDSLMFFMHPNLSWGGVLNKSVLATAGQGLDDYILEHVHKPKSGQVFELPAFNTPYKALFMAVLSDWDGGNGFEERDLLNCYRGVIERAQEKGLKRLAIPAMGRDKRDFPHIRFARLTLQGILEKLDARIDYVKVMCIDHTMIRTYTEQLEKYKRA